MNAPFSTPSPDLRAKLEVAVDRLLAILDALDGDDDLEPTMNADTGEFFGLVASGGLDECELDEDGEDDGTGEPSLGSLCGTWPSSLAPVSQAGWSGGAADDLEEEADSSEPSLGWTATIKQAGFGWAGRLDDAEGEHDGREPQEDEEPYLAGSDTDLEDDPAERSGIADAEGANEQRF